MCNIAVDNIPQFDLTVHSISAQAMIQKHQLLNLFIVEKAIDIMKQHPAIIMPL